MSYIKADERMVKGKDESLNFVVDFSDKLNPSESLSGTPTVTEATLSPSNVGINSSDLSVTTSDGRTQTVSANKGVQFSVGKVGTAGTTYTVTISVNTDSSPAETLDFSVDIEVVAAPS